MRDSMSTKEVEALMLSLFKHKRHAVRPESMVEQLPMALMLWLNG
jgi:hypothetical protein